MPISLARWESFYVITGTAGAALTGLMFVVIALTGDRAEGAPPDGVGAFSTPSVTHFANTLLLAGIMTVPVHRVLSLSLCLGGCAIFGLVSTGLAGARMRRLETYAAGAEDWAWHVILPLLAYLALAASALLVPASQALAVVGAATVSLLLLFIGIHNAWDVAVYLVTQGGNKAATAAGTDSSSSEQG
ncbi:MAG TPA: hypothetical protein VLX30_06415 [Burkholderiales bacterium]|nr:hypothetical protein [Burkholderiales bacterium]